MFKSWFERLQNLLTAITFAEAGESETACKYVDQRPAANRSVVRQKPVLAPQTRPAH